jgi:hypothetical protein
LDIDRFNLKKLNEGGVKEHNQVTIKSRFSALEILDSNGDITRVWDAIRENIEMPAKYSVK